MHVSDCLSYLRQVNDLLNCYHGAVRRLTYSIKDQTVFTFHSPPQHSPPVPSPILHHDYRTTYHHIWPTTCLQSTNWRAILSTTYIHCCIQLTLHDYAVLLTRYSTDYVALQTALLDNPRIDWNVNLICSLTKTRRTVVTDPRRNGQPDTTAMSTP